MAQKKVKAKQKTADKDAKTERTPPAPAPVPPAEPQPDEQPIPVPEPLPLPVPPPIAKQLPVHKAGSINHEDADGYPVDKQEESAEGDGWGAGDGGDWGGVDGSKEWGKGCSDGVNRESGGHDDFKEYGDHGNSGWGQTDTTPAHIIDQEQPSLGQPVQNHVPTQVTPAPAPPRPSPPSSIPSPPPSAVSVQPVQSSAVGHTKVATPHNKSQNPPQLEPKKYTFASSMANRNRPASKPASSSPPSSRPSHYWAPNQPLPQKQSMSTTKGQHNPPLSNLTPWGQPKNVDPWGDPKLQPNPPLPPPAAAPSAPLAATQKRPAWYDWGRQPQTAARAPPPADRRTYYTYDYDSDDDEYTDDEYTEADDGTHDVWGTPSNTNHGWEPDPRKQGHSGYQQQPQKHHSQAPHHHPEPSHHQLEKARRLKQIAEEQRRSAMEMEAYHQQNTHKQHHDRGVGKSYKHKGDGWHDDSNSGWGTMKDEWGASSGWVNDGGRGQDNNSWGQSGNDGWGQPESGKDREKDGGNSWDNGGNGWGNSGGGDGWNNGGDTWGNNGGDNWNNGGGNGWNNGGRNGWNNDGGDGWRNNDGGEWGKGQVKGDSKKDKSQGDAWAGHDSSWSNTQGFNDWGASNWDKDGGWGDGNDNQPLHEAEDDWGEASRYQVVTDSAQHQLSKTFMHAISTGNPQATKSSTSLKLGLPSGTLNESGNQAFEPAYKAIFGQERLARHRIHWMYSPENESQVISILFWIQQMESYLAYLGLLKFLETKERGALFVNVTFRLKEYPDKPVFDWLGYKQVQSSVDRILQHSILATDPAEQTVVFVYLLSRTGNSVAMWRRKLQVPKDIRQKHLQALKKVKAGLRPDQDRIHVDELPPSDKRKQTKESKSKQVTKAEPAKLTKDRISTKLTKSAFQTHQRGQSLPTVPEKKRNRKWWQILRFAD